MKNIKTGLLLLFLSAKGQGEQKNNIDILSVQQAIAAWHELATRFFPVHADGGANAMPLPPMIKHCVVKQLGDYIDILISCKSNPQLVERHLSIITELFFPPSSYKLKYVIGLDELARTLTPEEYSQKTAPIKQLQKNFREIREFFMLKNPEERNIMLAQLSSISISSDFHENLDLNFSQNAVTLMLVKLLVKFFLNPDKFLESDFSHLTYIIYGFKFVYSDFKFKVECGPILISKETLLNQITGYKSYGIILNFLK
jgi:hypothetical protein